MSQDLLSHKQLRVLHAAQRLELEWTVTKDPDGQVDMLVWNPRRPHADQVIVSSWPSPQTGRVLHCALLGKGVATSMWKRLSMCRVDVQLETMAAATLSPVPPTK